MCNKFEIKRYRNILMCDPRVWRFQNWKIILGTNRTHGLVAQWITRPPTERKIPGSSPGRSDLFEMSILNYNSLQIFYIFIVFDLRYFCPFFKIEIERPCSLRLS